MKLKGAPLLNDDTSVPDAKLSPNHPNNLETIPDIRNNRDHNKHKDKDMGNKQVVALQLPKDQQPPEAEVARSQ